MIKNRTFPNYVKGEKKYSTAVYHLHPDNRLLCHHDNWCFQVPAKLYGSFNFASFFLTMVEPEFHYQNQQNYSRIVKGLKRSRRFLLLTTKPHQNACEGLHDQIWRRELVCCRTEGQPAAPSLFFSKIFLWNTYFEMARKAVGNHNQ
jgi:hypothetical protein